MRQIMLDTETTGLNAKSGDRIIEIGCVELINRQLTGNNFHVYINPERDSELGALEVHGLTTEFLSDKPKFAEIAEDFLSYVKDAEIIIHNAPFDLGFLDAELERLSFSAFRSHVDSITDTLVTARSMFPGKRNSLDALCDRLDISNSHRTLHGALLDAALLAEVYLAMTRGQDSLSMDIDMSQEGGEAGQDAVLQMAEIIVLPASEDEIAAHEMILDGLDKQVKGICVWRRV
ncbi:MAG: DNA polymerase III subunit epsilon [Oxalobacter sp.]|nr:MAG: DNA polymerase III subunit epsilon [Oxalobacter sp.]